ncbi:MAG: hypothetical protein OXB86_04635 [Bdellovibrionales bacterium]|nr:hypothetical protein [Bdellovibrionales bacterium]
MKILLTIFIFTGLWFFHAPEAEIQIDTTSSSEKVCLPVKRKPIPLTDFNNPSSAKISPDGRWLLYGGKRDKNKKEVTPVILLNLSTGKKTEFLPAHSLTDSEDRSFIDADGRYDFANQGTLAWALSRKNNYIKLKPLPDGEEKLIHREANYQNIRSGIQKDIGILWRIDIEKDQLESLTAIEKKIKLKPAEERETLKKEYEDKMESFHLILRLMNMNTLSEI